MQLYYSPTEFWLAAGCLLSNAIISITILTSTAMLPVLLTLLLDAVNIFINKLNIHLVKS